MPLEAHVTARISTQLLVELTNPGSTTATTVNAALLSLAVKDVQADMRIHAATVYDDIDARHISIGVELVVMKLQSWLIRTPLRETIGAQYRALLERLALVTGRNRIVPTTGVLERGETPRVFPPQVFDPMVPGTGLGARDKDSIPQPL